MDSVSVTLKQRSTERAPIKKPTRFQDEDYKQKLEMVNREINEHQSNLEYSDSIVRNMIECIKAFADGRLEVYFGGGNMVEEHV